MSCSRLVGIRYAIHALVISHHDNSPIRSADLILFCITDIEIILLLILRPLYIGFLRSTIALTLPATGMSSVAFSSVKSLFPSLEYLGL